VGSMAMNWREIEAVALELKQLELASVSRCYQPLANTIILELRHEGQNCFLLISVDDDSSRLHLVRSKQKNPQVPYGFVSMLRANLEPARLQKVSHIEGDRVVMFHFDSLAHGEIENFCLVVELTGRHANAFLLDSDDKILGLLRYNHSRKRKLLPQSTYTPPLKCEAKEVEIRYELSAGEFQHNHAADLFFGVNATKEIKRRRKKKLLDHIKRSLKRIKSTEKALERDLIKTDRSPELRLWADLLQINFTAIKPGMEQIVLPDVINANSDDVAITLDRKLRPQKNISRLYEKAKKLERGGPKILARMEAIADEKDHLERLQELLQEDDSVEVVKRISAKLGLKDESERKLTKAQQQFEKAPPFRRFISESGQEIRVGRNAKENDRLTFGMSKGDDFWFHASGYAGSHVTVPMKKNAMIDNATLIDAATLAAHYSKARGGSVEVDYTRARYLRKPSKRQPGQVVFSRHKSLFINPDDERIRRLMSGDALK